MDQLPPALRRTLTEEDFVQGVSSGDRAVLGRTLTLVESSAPGHQELAARVLERLLPRAGRAMRLGITGAPGVGKSTLIEALGLRLLASGRRVAVLAVDPSSTVSRGSILGDKTRMPELSRDPRAFIRPSPSAGSLGGVARKTREGITVCEAAGFDVVLVETVGVGQSEVTVRSMVDLFLLLLLPGAGDSLQGIKKGVVELADALVVTQADGDGLARAIRTRDDYASALQLVASPTPSWRPEVLLCSALEGRGLDELWELALRFFETARRSGALEERRRAQALDWMHATVQEELRYRFYTDPEVAALLPELERAVGEGELPAMTAARRLLETASKGK